MFGEDHLCGYDPTFSRDSNNNLVSVCVKKKKYTIVKCVYAAQSLIGRGTRVWEVSEGGKRYILKDSWIQHKSTISEVETLKLMQGLQNVPFLYDSEDVLVQGQVDDMRVLRGDGWGHEGNSRVHRRLVLGPVGVHISMFRTRRELISAFRDIVVGLSIAQ